MYKRKGGSLVRMSRERQRERTERTERTERKRERAQRERGRERAAQKLLEGGPSSGQVGEVKGSHSKLTQDLFAHFNPHTNQTLVCKR